MPFALLIWHYSAPFRTVRQAGNVQGTREAEGRTLLLGVFATHPHAQIHDSGDHQQRHDPDARNS